MGRAEKGTIKKGSQDQGHIGRSIIPCLSSNLFPSHEILDIVMAPDMKKDNLVGELKQDAVFEFGTDFPVVAMPVFEAEAVRKFSTAIHIFHEGVDCLINLLLTGGGEFLETAVKAGPKFVSHATSSGVLGVYERQRSLCSGCPVLSSTHRAWQPVFLIVTTEFIDSDRLYSQGRAITFDSHIITLVHMEPVHERLGNSALFVSGNTP